ncbi:MAG: hypothetical protein Q7P63_10440 [Verrucomicrobiota bacterium JB022]|nr:hypothetical protein [Verrucomicrobiota bacterium JB022]
MSTIVELKEELKNLEKEEQKIARMKEQIAAKIQEEKQEDQRLDEIFNNSGYATPRALVKALMVKYGIKVSGSAANGKPRKRTRITSELRDSVKAEVNAGGSKNSISKKYEISYAVVSKIMKGDYDHL